MTFSEEELERLTMQYIVVPSPAHTDLLNYVKACIADAERDRDSAIEVLADYKRQSAADVRNHPDFLKLVESDKRRAAFCRYWEQMSEIQDERLELATREIALLKSR